MINSDIRFSKQFWQKYIGQLEKLRIDYSNAAVRACNAGYDRPGHLKSPITSFYYVQFAGFVDLFLQQKRDGLIVDWGGQFGQMTAYLDELGYEAENYVIDTVEEYKYFSHLVPRLKIGKSPVFIPYRDKSALVLISCGVLEHVKESGSTEKESLKEIYRILKPGGFFFIFLLPNKYSMLEFLYNILHIIFGRWHHLYKYSKKEIISLLESTGFEIIFYDREEFLPKVNFRLSRIGGKILSPRILFKLDWFVSHLPILNIFAQHHIIVVRKSK